MSFSEHRVFFKHLAGLMIGSTLLVVFIGFFLSTMQARAVTRTWDGGGVTENWSEDANWSGDVEPGVNDLAAFDGTSTKNATIDTAINVGGITMNSGYTGVITQGAGNTVTIGTQNFVTSSGTFTGGDSAITLSGSFTVSGGAFTSTTGTFSIAGNWTVSSGTFEPSTGTMTSTGGTSTWNVVTTETVNNMTVAKNNGASLFISSGDTIVVAGALTLTDGYLETGTIDTRGDTTQSANFDGWDTIIDFGNDVVAQTYTINGGIGPQLRLDSAADANDSIVYNAAGTLRVFTVTSGFSGTIPITNAGDHTMTFLSWTQNGGTFNGASFSNIVLSGGTFTIGSGAVFNAPTTITTIGTTWDVNTTQTVNNLTHSSGTLTLNSLDTVVVSGTLTLTAGALNGGIFDTRGNTIQNAGAVAGTATVDFGDNSVAQTYTINGGTGANLRLDNAADANDSVIFNAAGGFYIFTTTAGFTGTIPFSNPSNFAMSFWNWLQSGGDYTNNYCSGSCSTMNLGGGSTSFTIASPATFVAPTTMNVSSTGMSWDVNSSQTVNNLSISTTVALTIATGDTITTDGTLTLTNGSLNGGTLNANGNIVQNSGSAAGSTILNFANNSLAQTYTINGGTGPSLVLDSASDASDSIVYGAAGGLFRLTTTSDFSGTIPISNPSNFAMSFNNWSQSGGDYTNNYCSGSCSTMNLGGGTTSFVIVSPATFTAPTTINVSSTGMSWDVNSSQTVNNLNVATTVSWTITAGDTVVVAGNFAVTAGGVATGNLELQGNLTQTGSGSISAPTKFSGSGTQSVSFATPSNQNGDVTVDKTGGQVNLATAWDLDAASQDLTIVEGTFDIAGFNLNVEGTSGTFIVQDGGVFERYGAETLTLNVGLPTLQTGSTVRYTGDGDTASDTYTITSMATTYSNLTIASTDGLTDTFQLGAALDVNGNLSNSGTFTVTGTNHQVNVAGNWTNTGTFVANAGSVILDGTNQTLSGSTTFNNLTKNVSSAATLTLPAGATQTISGAMDLQGVAGQLLSLRSSTNGVQSFTSPSGTRTVMYVDVKDQNNSSGININCDETCEDSGNNTAWFASAAGGGSGFTPPQNNPQDLVIVNSPNGGETYMVGAVIPITWTTGGSNITEVHISVSRDDGGSFKTVVVQTPDDGSYFWTVSGPATGGARIRIEGTDGTSVLNADTSDSFFTIVAATIPQPPVNPPVNPPENPSPLVNGEFIKLAEMSTVYMVTEGNVRRPFFNPTIFHIYEKDFSRVRVVGVEEFNSHALASMMLPLPGTVLVKTQDSARVYALEDNPEDPRTPITRWLTTEEIAVAIYGDDWADFVIDVDPVVMAAFVPGEPITTLEDTDLVPLRTRFELVLKQRLRWIH